MLSSLKARVSKTGSQDKEAAAEEEDQEPDDSDPEEAQNSYLTRDMKLLIGLSAGVIAALGIGIAMGVVVCFALAALSVPVVIGLANGEVEPRIRASRKGAKFKSLTEEEASKTIEVEEVSNDGKVYVNSQADDVKTSDASPMDKSENVFFRKRTKALDSPALVNGKNGIDIGEARNGAVTRRSFSSTGALETTAD